MISVGAVEPVLSPHAALRVLDRYFATHTSTKETEQALTRLWTLVIEGK
jgi:hypothetical protein